MLVDVDGTLALAQGRDPYDEPTVSADAPNTAIITIVRALYRDGHRVVVLSGRTETARVVSLWRSLDLTCLQVAPGDF